MYPPVNTRVTVGPVLRIWAEVVGRVAYEATRERLSELADEPIGFVARAVGERSRELRAEGRSWTDADVRDFLDHRLPAALDAARAHKEGAAP